MAKRTCVMCGKPLGKKSTYTGALIFGNKSRDPHVGPYCKNCGPPSIQETKTVEYVKDCPMAEEEWITVDHCITKHKRHPHTRIKCEFSLGRSPIRQGDISCIHPDRRNRKVQSLATTVIENE